MANLISLVGFKEASVGGKDDWAFDNADDHIFVRDMVQVKNTVNLVQYPLYPLNWDRWDTFAMTHQSAHDEINELLGLPGTDLTGVDFNDPKKAEEWHLSHYREHEAWHAALGI